MDPSLATLTETENAFSLCTMIPCTLKALLNMYEISNIPLEETPDPKPTVYVWEFLSFGGFGDVVRYAPFGVCWGFFEKIGILLLMAESLCRGW